MNLGDPSDDECTAAPGVMGHRGCRRYPGCGCGDSREPEEVLLVELSPRLFGEPHRAPHFTRKTAPLHEQHAQLALIGIHANKLTEYANTRIALGQSVAPGLIRDLRRELATLTDLVDRLEKDG